MNFRQAIKRYKWTWSLGQSFQLLLRVAAALIVFIVLYGFVDAIWPLNNGVRSFVNRLILVVSCLLVMVLIYRVYRTPLEELARAADSGSADRSAKFLAAYDLSNADSSSELHQYLSMRSQESAVADLGELGWMKRVPLRGICVGVISVLLMAIIAYGVRGFNPPVYDNVVQRLKYPERDIPPYSPLKFLVTQDADYTVYGEDNKVRVEISGGEINEDVMCLVKNKQTGEVNSISTFKQSSRVFSKNFTHLSKDLEYAFSCGRARSEWHSIKVLLQPKFTEVMIKITPPAYTKKKAVEFSLEGNEIKLIRGSAVELTVTSNRPLSGGDLVIVSEGSDLEREDKVEGVADDKRVVFKWLVSYTSKVSCTLRDLRNTVSASSLDFGLTARSDMAPVADLSSPGRFVLATPNTKLPLAGNVEDDFEVDSVHLVRNLVGYRDRASELASEVSKDVYDFEKEIDLREIGVEVDQILEFYLEASDNNPSLLGIATSDVVKVQIISDEDYAERIRVASDWRDFNLRFGILSGAVRDAIGSLKALDKVYQENDMQAFLVERDVAKKVHEASYEAALKLAEEFNAYSKEADLAEEAERVSVKLINNINQLVDFTIGSGEVEIEESIREMLARLGASLKEIEELEEEAEDIQKWAAVAEQAAIYLKLHRNQLSIAERISKIVREIQMGERRNAPQVKALGEAQRKNKGQLLKFANDLKAAAAGLDNQDLELQADCGVWLDAFHQLNIPDAMEAVTKSAEVGKSHDAATNAFLAYKLMKELIEMNDNEFAKLLRNDEEDKPNDQNKRQILDALMKQHGDEGEGKGEGEKGKGQGRGMGMGNGQGGGKLMRNRNIPMFGPKRNKLGRNGGGFGRGGGSGGGSGRGAGNTPKVSDKNSIESAKKRESNTSQAFRTNVPDKYKEAVKRFYSESENENGE